MIPARSAYTYNSLTQGSGTLDSKSQFSHHSLNLIFIDRVAQRSLLSKAWKGTWVCGVVPNISQKRSSLLNIAGCSLKLVCRYDNWPPYDSVVMRPMIHLCNTLSLCLSCWCCVLVSKRYILSLFLRHFWTVNTCSWGSVGNPQPQPKSTDRLSFCLFKSYQCGVCWHQIIFALNYIHMLGIYTI